MDLGLVEDDPAARAAVAAAEGGVQLAAEQGGGVGGRAGRVGPGVEVAVEDFGDERFGGGVEGGLDGGVVEGVWIGESAGRAGCHGRGYHGERVAIRHGRSKTSLTLGIFASMAAEALAIV